MRVFLDANVLFAGAKFGSQVARLVRRIMDRGTVVSSDYAREEAIRNIRVKRPAWQEEFDALCERIEWIGTGCFTLEVELAEKDVPILCSAIAGRCDYLVTGDKRDFGHLFGKMVHGVEVVSLTQLAEVLSE